MKKPGKWMILGLAAVCALAGCSKKEAAEDQNSIQATVLKNQVGETYFMDEEGKLFRVEELDPDVDEKLQQGDTVKITGSGYISERDPYPGVYTKVTGVKKTADGSPEDAAGYQEQAAALYENWEPSSKPDLRLEYLKEDKAVSVLLSAYELNWTYSDDVGMHGETSIEITALEYEDLPGIEAEDASDINLYFPGRMDTVTAVRWPADLWMTEDVSKAGEGESVPLTEEGMHWVIPRAESGYVYQITASREEGYVEFGFLME